MQFQSYNVDFYMESSPNIRQIKYDTAALGSSEVHIDAEQQLRPTVTHWNGKTFSLLKARNKQHEREKLGGWSNCE